MLPREIFKSGDSKIAFPAFWEQFLAFFNQIKSLIEYVTWTLYSPYWTGLLYKLNFDTFVGKRYKDGTGKTELG